MHIFDFVDVLRKGSAVADPAAWKNRGAAAIAVTGLLVAANALAKGYGYDLGLSDMDIGSIGTAVAVIVGLFVTYATSDKVGLPAKPDESAKAGLN